ncbi:hypothetical protein ACEPAI_8288 [Sanghuangporus weigelae]
MAKASTGLLGIVLLARHGDRLGFYQDPFTYTASDTSITPLGSVQEFQLGQLIRSLYMEDNSPFRIEGISTGLFDEAQVKARADAGGEGSVILDSAASLLQGLFPPTRNHNITLANGTLVVAPLHGYQYVPVESVEPDCDISLEAWVNCKTFDEATEAFYNSSLFVQVEDENADFLQSLKPFLDGRSVSLVNTTKIIYVQIFDFMNVESIHNASFGKRLPPGALAHARALANFHEYGVFSSPRVDGIGNIAGRAIVPTIIQGMERIANNSDPLKFFYEAISYKPFISLFNMTGLASEYPELAGVVNYAAAVVFELREGYEKNDPLIRFKFKNETDSKEFKTFDLFGRRGDVPLSLFKSKLLPAAINNTAEWCAACNNHESRGCEGLGATKGIGWGITLTAMEFGALIVATLACMFFVFLYPLSSRKTGAKRVDSSSSMEKVVSK